MSKDARTKRRELTDKRINSSGYDQALVDKKMKDNRKIRYESDIMIERLSSYRKEKGI